MADSSWTLSTIINPKKCPLLPPHDLIPTDCLLQYTYMQRGLIVLVILSVFCIAPKMVAAQFSGDFNGGTQALTLELNPAYPAPGETVTATLDDYALGVAFSTISWSFNGKTEPTLDNTRSFTFTAPNLGETATIKAALKLPAGITLEATGKVTPLYTDIIVEPQTYTPQTYAGRALPTVGSLVRATAFVTNTNGPLNPLLYSYQWKLNGTALNGGAKTGAFQTSYVVPYGNNHTLSVEVYDKNGMLITRRNTNVRVSEVSLVLYEVNSLYGLGTTALTQVTPFLSTAFTLRAVPYNLDLRSTPQNTFTEWRVGNRVVTSESGDPYEITLERSGEGQNAVAFKLRHREALLQGGEVHTLLDF